MFEKLSEYGLMVQSYQVIVTQQKLVIFVHVTLKGGTDYAMYVLNLALV